METKTKIILGVLAVGTIAILTREKWMPIFSKKEKSSNMVDGGSGTTKGGWTKTKNKIKGVTNI